MLKRCERCDLLHGPSSARCDHCGWSEFRTVHDPHDTRPKLRERAAALVALHDFDPVHGHCRTCGELPELAALSGCERMNHDSEPASRELLRSRGIERPELAATVAALVAARERRA